jgi:hypothetical protein
VRLSLKGDVILLKRDANLLNQKLHLLKRDAAFAPTVFFMRAHSILVALVSHFSFNVHRIFLSVLYYLISLLAHHTHKNMKTVFCVPFLPLFNPHCNLTCTNHSPLIAAIVNLNHPTPSCSHQEENRNLIAVAFVLAHISKASGLTFQHQNDFSQLCTRRTVSSITNVQC